MQGYALYYHKNIVQILDEINRELLLVMKTNNYLRAIDRRLGNPNNTFSVVNQMTWDVYRKESKDGTWQFCKEYVRYWFVRIGLLGMYFLLRARMALGFYCDEEALQDFDQAIALESTNPVIYSNRGLVNRKLERFA